MEHGLNLLRNLLHSLILPVMGNRLGDSFSYWVADADAGYSSHPVAEEFVRQYRALGFKYVGSGYFSVVLRHKSLPTRVFKIGFKQEDAYAAYIGYCRQNPGPHIPVIHHAERMGQFQVAVLTKYERLYYLDEADQLVINAAKRGATYYGESSLGSAVNGIAEFFAGIAVLDIHTDNIMQDADGCLIITDPVSFTTVGDEHA